MSVAERLSLLTRLLENLEMRGDADTVRDAAVALIRMEIEDRRAETEALDEIQG